MSRRVTLQLIAEELGLSVQTVSNVQRGTGRVAPQTRERVQRALQAHGYVPSAAASALRGGKTATLGFVVQDPAYVSTVSPYLSHAIVSLSHAISQVNYQPMVTLLPDASVDALLGAVGSHLLDGLLLLSALDDESELQRLARTRLPIVLFDRASPLLPSVSATYRAAMGEVVDQLRARGARQLAYLGGAYPQEGRGSALERHEGFVERARQLGLPPPLLTHGDWTPLSGWQAFQQLWDAPERPDAIVCANDQMALGVVQAALSAGLRIPEEVQITGFDDLQRAGADFLGRLNGFPELSSVRLPLTEMAQHAVRLLLERLHVPDGPPAQAVVPTSFHARSTTR